MNHTDMLLSLVPVLAGRLLVERAGVAPKPVGDCTPRSTSLTASATGAAITCWHCWRVGLELVAVGVVDRGHRARVAVQAAGGERRVGVGQLERADGGDAEGERRHHARVARVGRASMPISWARW